MSQVYERLQMLEDENKDLKTENYTLKAEKKLLADQVAYFQSLVKSISTSNRSHTNETTNSLFSHHDENERQSNISKEEEIDEEKGGDFET